MESLSRPFHRRKLSNVNSFSSKNVYDGVFSGHRPKFDGVPAVNVEEYHEIFSSAQAAASSIPVLDLSSLQESSDDLSLELGSSKPDYGMIFGGFRDEDIAVSYEELVARDKARAPMSTSQSSQDLDDDLAHQSFDALKQFNMSYNKITQSKDGLDGTTHVTQLHAVPGFTCFIDEAASQPKKETKNKKSLIPKNIQSPEKQTSQTPVVYKSTYHQDESLSDDKKTDLKSHPSKISSPKKEAEKQKSSIPNRVHSPEKQTSQTPVEYKSTYHQDESLSDDKKTDLKSHSSKVSSPKKEAEKQKSSIPNNVHSPEKQTSQTAVESKSKYYEDGTKVNLKSDNSKVSSSPTASAINIQAASQPKLETEKKKSSETDNVHPINSRKGDFSEKKTSESAVESKSKYHHDESLSDDKKIDLKSYISKVSSSSATSVTNGEPTSQSKKENDFLAKQTSQSAVDSRSKYGQDESSLDDRVSKNFVADINLHSSRGSTSPATSATNVDNHKNYQKRSTVTSNGTWKNDTPGAFSSTLFDEELDVTSAAGASAAALRKAIEKAQESIRIAKESVGRNKEGLKSFSSKSFKDSLKVKARVANVSPVEEQKEKDNWIKEIFKARVANVGASEVSSNVERNHKHEGTVVFSKFTDGEKLFGAKKVINEIHGKILETEKNSEMPIGSCHELKDNNIVCDSKEVFGETEVVEHATRSSEEVETDSHESLKNDNQRPNDVFVLESCENKIKDTEETNKDDKPIDSKENKYEVGPGIVYELGEETNNLTLYQKVEDEKKVSQDSDENDYEKRFNESLGFLENTKQEVLEQELYEEVASAENHDPNSDNEASEKVFEEERELKEDSDTESHTEEDMGEKFYDVCEVDIIENSSSDYDDAEESESIHGCHGANRIEIDTEEACKVDQSENDVESSQEVDDVCHCSPQVTVEETEAISTEEKEIFETISADQTASINNEDEREQESDEELSYCGSVDVDETEQNDEQPESCLDTIRGMEIEVKEYQEREETIKKEEESNLHESHSERPETIFQMETGTSQEPKDMNDETKESEPSKVVEKDHQKKIEVTDEEKERERNKLAAERAFREARERAFNETRERAERAAVERATAEVRQRVMSDAQEKVAKASAAPKASDTTSKIKAERAAVERATAEARQRALEKAMSQKKVSEPITQANEVRQTSSDLHISNGTSTESALRSKAKLEMENRSKERVAKALAEKEKRDQLAQKEQAERSRLSENLDADIKRWSTGKEGNLRALLSTLQYILGPESGWQSVSLTEIITTSAVKKAYRKATLCVHPDKLQQRGASIQQKYICEKVFDLLKVAWNRFNSAER